jgi:ADP-ribose pyrophosphatase YjhB (NUDIX family)
MFMGSRRCGSTTLVRRRVSSVPFQPITIIKLHQVSLFYPGSSVSPSLRSEIQSCLSETKHPVVAYRPMSSTPRTLLDRLAQQNQAAVDDPTKQQPSATTRTSTTTTSHGRKNNNSNGRGDYREGSGWGNQSHSGRGGGTNDGSKGEGRGGGGRGNYYSSGRGGGGRGRGDARDGTWSRKSSTPKNNYNNRQPLPPAPVVVTEDFPSMHQTYGRHAYKVHKPGCQCPKIQQVRLALQSAKNPRQTTTTTTTTTTMPQQEESKDDPIYQSSSLASAISSTAMAEQQQKQQLLLELDGLVVIPDTKTIPFLYLCRHTGIQEFQRDAMAAEQKLQDEMFPTTHEEKTTQSSETTTTSSSSSSSPSSSFKASCASCLLEEIPNGFVCVASSRQTTVDMARDLARQRAAEKSSAAMLHSDHAHYVCSLSNNKMSQLVLYRARTRQQTREAAGPIVEQFIQQGLPAQVGETVEVGHHLKSLLQLSSSKSTMSSRRDKDASNFQYYWLVLVYDDRAKGGYWTIDLPGGKRHLGETTFQCAIRETEEEISLHIDETWKTEENPRSGRPDTMNAYYFLTPPPPPPPAPSLSLEKNEIRMEQITEDKFWKRPGLS